MPSTLLTRARPRRYSQPNIATDIAITYATLPNVALHEERKPAWTAARGRVIAPMSASAL